MNMGVQISLQDTDLIFFRYIYPEERLLDHMVALFLIFWGTSILISGGFLGGASGKEPTCQCRRCKRHGFNPWVRKIPWRRKWQPTPVFLPGESHGQRSLAGYSPWGCKESDMTLPLSIYWFPYWLHQCTFPPIVNKGSLFPTFSSLLAISCLFHNNHFNMWVWGDMSLVVFICISLTSSVEHLFIYVVAICTSSLEIFPWAYNFRRVDLILVYFYS